MTQQKWESFYAELLDKESAYGHKGFYTPEEYDQVMALVRRIINGAART